MQTSGNEPGMIVTCRFTRLVPRSQPKVAGIQPWHAQACKQKAHLQLHKADLSQTEPANSISRITSLAFTSSVSESLPLPSVTLLLLMLLHHLK